MFEIIFVDVFVTLCSLYFISMSMLFISYYEC